MTIANESYMCERFIHEIVHEIADDEEVLEYCIDIDNEEAKEGLRNLVSIILNKWEGYKEEYDIYDDG